MGDKSQLALTVAAVVGSLMMILLPVVVTILWNTWKDQTKATVENTLALTKLKTEIEFIWKESRKIPELEKDVQGWHNKVRDMEGILKRNSLT